MAKGFFYVSASPHGLTPFLCEVPPKIQFQIQIQIQFQFQIQTRKTLEVVFHLLSNWIIWRRFLKLMVNNYKVTFSLSVAMCFLAPYNSPV